MLPSFSVRKPSLGIKSPHWPHGVRVALAALAALAAEVLIAAEEIQVPRVSAGELIRTPIVDSQKTTNYVTISAHRAEFTYKR